MLRYCSWCGNYQGAKAGSGYQVRKNVSEIDTATICQPCYTKMMQNIIPTPLVDNEVTNL